MADSWLYAFFYGLHLLAAAAAALHILLNMRDDSERASLWLILVAAFPVLGVILYLFAGLSRRNSLGSRLEKARNEFEEPGSDSARRFFAEYNAALSGFVAPEKEESVRNISFRVMLDRVFPDSPPLLGNSVELLRDGDAAYPMMIDAIRKAKKSIHLQSFIIANDSVGKMIFDALEKKARHGVEVKVIYDSFGSFSAILSHFFHRYSRRNSRMQIRAFVHSNLFAPWKIQLRNHRKLLVTDGETAFLGGINISADNFRLINRRAPAIHDLHCRVRGPAVGMLQRSFLRDWCYAANLAPDNVLNKEVFPPPVSSGNDLVRVIASGHGHCYQGTEKAFFTATATAKRYIWINTPYFVPDHAFSKALRIAAQRGVDVRILLPEKNNHWYMKMAGRSLYESLLSDGVRIFERHGNFSHAKAMLVDGEWTLFGSSNCDVRSFRLNYELDIVVSGGDFLSSIHDQFRHEFAQSREILFEEIRSRGFFTRLLESLCALFTPVL